jgi:hypothetical protein
LLIDERLVIVAANITVGRQVVVSLEGHSRALQTSGVLVQ